MTRTPPGWTKWALLALCALGTSYFFVYIPAINNPNENVRLYMTRSMVEWESMALGVRQREGQALVDRGPGVEEWGWVNDKALVCFDDWETPPNCEGTLYSAKAPGASFLGVPVYAALHAASPDGVDKTAAIFWLRLLTVLLPTWIFFFFFERFLRPFAPSAFARYLTVVALAFGTMSMTYGQMYAGHQHAALSIFAALMALHSAATRPRGQRVLPFALAGFFLPTAVAMEYTAALLALPLLAWGLTLRPTLRELGAGLLAAVPPVLAVSAFHHIAFGAPWRTPYSWLENPNFVEDVAPGFFGLEGPNLNAFAGALLSPANGLYFFSPWCLIAVIAAGGWLLRRRIPTPGPVEHAGATRQTIVMALVIVVIELLFISSHALWHGGWTVGPRYIQSVVPPTAFLVAVATQRWLDRAPWTATAVVGGLAGASIIVTGACTAVSLGFPPSFMNPFGQAALPLIREGYISANAGNWLGLSGAMSALPFIGITMVAVALPFALHDRLPPAARLSSAAAALLLAVGLSSAQSQAHTRWNEAEARDYDWLRSIWVPEAQAPGQRLESALNEAPRELRQTPEFWMARGRIEARAGRTTQALRHYRRGRRLANGALNSSNE